LHYPAAIRVSRSNGVRASVDWHFHMLDSETPRLSGRGIPAMHSPIRSVTCPAKVLQLDGTRHDQHHTSVRLLSDPGDVSVLAVSQHERLEFIYPSIGLDGKHPKFVFSDF
jgi:hypothetical protein